MLMEAWRKLKSRFKNLRETRTSKFMLSNSLFSNLLKEPSHSFMVFSKFWDILSAEKRNRIRGAPNEFSRSSIYIKKLAFTRVYQIMGKFFHFLCIHLASDFNSHKTHTNSMQNLQENTKKHTSNIQILSNIQKVKIQNSKIPKTIQTQKYNHLNTKIPIQIGKLGS